MPAVGPMIVTRFAEHRPEAHGAGPPEGLTIRVAGVDDCQVMAALEHIRGDVTLDEGERRCRRQVDDPAVHLLVAEIGGATVGFARAARFIPPEDPPPDIAPAGWYLFGVVVEDRWRRHGIGRALTEARLAWIGERATEAWYFTNARNEASLDLHAGLGFEEVTRTFTIPGTTFDGGVGVLCRATLVR